MSNLYEKLPDDLLAQFYVEINKNIDEGILTDAMCFELELIEEIFEKRECNEHLKDLFRNICQSKQKINKTFT